MRTELLWVGCTDASWKAHKDVAKDNLMRIDACWQFASTCRSTFKSAAEFARIRHELEVAVVTNEFGLNEVDLASGCLSLAQALRANRSHPWVTFSNAGLEPMEPIFTKVGVHVEIGNIEWVVRERWAARIRAAA